MPNPPSTERSVSEAVGSGLQTGVQVIGALHQRDVEHNVNEIRSQGMEGAFDYLSSSMGEQQYLQQQAQARQRQEQIQQLQQQLQQQQAPVQAPPPAPSRTWMYVAGGVAAVGIIGAVVWYMAKKR